MLAQMIPDFASDFASDLRLDYQWEIALVKPSGNQKIVGRVLVLYLELGPANFLHMSE